jgi:hypothetical protein
LDLASIILAICTIVEGEGVLKTSSGLEMMTVSDFFDSLLGYLKVFATLFGSIVFFFALLSLEEKLE